MVQHLDYVLIWFQVWVTAWTLNKICIQVWVGFHAEGPNTQCQDHNLHYIICNQEYDPLTKRYMIQVYIWNIWVWINYILFFESGLDNTMLVKLFVFHASQQWMWHGPYLEKKKNTVDGLWTFTQWAWLKNLSNEWAMAHIQLVSNISWWRVDSSFLCAANCKM